jgi:hypothetical protein
VAAKRIALVRSGSSSLHVRYMVLLGDRGIV